MGKIFSYVCSAERHCIFFESKQKRYFHVSQTGGWTYFDKFTAFCFLMAAYRKISITFWSDSFVQSLTPEAKYFYLYLMTNTRTTQCGIYEITISQICFETGYNSETVVKLISQFESYGKIKWSQKTNEIALKNWAKYNESTSPKVRSCVANELKSVKNKVLIQYLYSMDTESQETKAKAKTKEETKAKDRAWFESHFDELFLEQMQMTHKGKDVARAIGESWAHLSADPLRLHNADGSDCKKLLNTWLSNMKPEIKEHRKPTFDLKSLKI